MQAEYCFPLTHNIDTGIRGQSQIFFEPFFLNTNGTTVLIPPQLLQIAPQLNPQRMSTVINVGAFLRLRL